MPFFTPTPFVCVHSKLPEKLAAKGEGARKCVEIREKHDFKRSHMRSIKWTLKLKTTILF